MDSNTHLSLLEIAGLVLIASSVMRLFVEFTFWYSWKRAKAEMDVEKAKTQAKATP